MKNIKYTSLMLAAILALGACSEKTKQNLGLVNTAPDEFAVVTRAPLSVPPDYALRPPRPGAGRPMEMTTQEQARKTVFGEADVKGTYRNPATGTDNAFLNKVGVQNADPNIRNTVDSEKSTDTRTTAEKLLFMSGDENDNGDPIDPNAEYERLKQEGVVTTKKRTE